MSLELLDKTRKIYRLLNRQESEKVDFNDFCRMLSQEMEVNVLLLSRKGKILGMRVRKDIPVIPQIQDINYGDYLQKDIHERILNILSTKENVNLLTLGFNFDRCRIIRQWWHRSIWRGRDLEHFLYIAGQGCFPLTILS